MQTLDHEHIVKCYGEFIFSSEIQCILIEFCEVKKFSINIIDLSRPGYISLLQLYLG
jgi:hypothetical protein